MKQACERDEVMQAKRRGESSHVKPSRFTIRHPRFTIYCSIQFQGPVQKKKKRFTRDCNECEPKRWLHHVSSRHALKPFVQSRS